MGTLRVPCKVKLVAGLLSRDEGLFAETKKHLEKIFGRCDYESRALDFTHTGYYAEEMGDGLKRKFLAFERLLGPASAYKAKLKTNRLEKIFISEGRRQVNIDPGYLDLSKLVLFSTKDYIHRIYLNGGIFAEVTLYYKDKSFKAWPWTYPDYASSVYIDIFNSLREKYKDLMSKERQKI